METAIATTLFEKLGGEKAIEAVVKEFYKRVLADSELKGYFDGIDMDFQTKQQINFITMAVGGPNNYEGRSMKDAHDKLGITEPHFNKVAEHLVNTLKWAGVSDELVNEVIEIVGPLKKDIVCC